MLWLVLSADIIMSALFSFSAVVNLRVNVPYYPAAFNTFYLCLSTATPFLMVAASVTLGLDLWHKKTPGRKTRFLHRCIFWALILRSLSLILLSFIIPNESLHALVAFVSGVFFFFPAMVAFLGGLFLYSSKR